MDLGLKDKVMMVAASSSGLGFAIARNLAKEGAKLSIASRNVKHIEQAATEIRKESDAEIFPSVMDITDPFTIEAWTKNTMEKFGRIDGLVVNAGGPPAGRFDDLDDSKWVAGFELTLMGTVRMIRQVLPQMRKQKSGSILTVTSVSIKEPIDNLLLSNVMRSGVSSLLKSLSFDLARQGIRINNLVPGLFGTERLKSLDLINSREWRMTVEEVQNINYSNIPMGRYGDPDEFGKAATFLLSDAASYVTGETFFVDGGRTRSVR
ncbi:MAG: SDR family oxidoreductase [Bacteroidales bacterium]|nr:SDR family oxidoreductase [Bacteroidales bacterium]MDT8431144.1 SDR family oxidoreductase [Bacteroidales bacterium]